MISLGGNLVINCLVTILGVVFTIYFVRNRNSFTNGSHLAKVVAYVLWAIIGVGVGLLFMSVPAVLNLNLSSVPRYALFSLPMIGGVIGFLIARRSQSAFSLKASKNDWGIYASGILAGFVTALTIGALIGLSFPLTGGELFGIAILGAILGLIFAAVYAKNHS